MPHYRSSERQRWGLRGKRYQRPPPAGSATSPHLRCKAFSRHSDRGPNIAHGGWISGEDNAPMSRKTVIAIAVTAALGSAVALAPTLAAARGGGGGHGGGHGG